MNSAARNGNNSRKGIKAALAASVLSVSQISAGLPALAESITFRPEDNTNGGAIVGRIPLDKFGTIPMPRGRVSFKNHFLEVSAIPEYQFDRQVVLSGPILKCACINTGSKVYLNGFAYFQSGDWLRYIDDSSQDIVTTNSKVYVGQITALKNGGIEFTPEGGSAIDIPTADIRDISSPRVYNFSVPVSAYLNVPSGSPVNGDAKYLSLKASNQPIKLAAVKSDPLMAGDGDVSNRRLIATGLALTAASTAQFIPLILTFGPQRNELARQYVGRFQDYYNQQNFLNNYFTSGQLIPITPGAPGYGFTQGGI
jgi:hypothetical protein